MRGHEPKNPNLSELRVNEPGFASVKAHGTQRDATVDIKICVTERELASIKADDIPRNATVNSPSYVSSFSLRLPETRMHICYISRMSFYPATQTHLQRN